jgi:hypothetical protein
MEGGAMWSMAMESAKLKWFPVTMMGPFSGIFSSPMTSKSENVCNARDIKPFNTERITNLRGTLMSDMNGSSEHYLI